MDVNNLKRDHQNHSRIHYYRKPTTKGLEKLQMNERRLLYVASDEDFSSSSGVDLVHFFPAGSSTVTENEGKIKSQKDGYVGTIMFICKTIYLYIIIRKECTGPLINDQLKACTFLSFSRRIIQNKQNPLPHELYMLEESKSGWYLLRFLNFRLLGPAPGCTQYSESLRVDCFFVEVDERCFFFSWGSTAFLSKLIFLTGVSSKCLHCFLLGLLSNIIQPLFLL